MAALPCIQCGTVLAGLRCNECGIAATAGRWRIIRVLAEHGWSRVYLAEDADGQHAALKELLFSVVPSTTQLEAFAREAGLLRQISHPNVPRFLESFQEGTGVNTRFYVAQEFVPGESLASQIGRRTFTEDDVGHIAQQVLTTLSYLHGCQPRIVHRDIKPSNLIVREDDSIALVDFGTARGVDDRTFRSTFAGTFGYAPVEQLGGTVDATSDLYALGATLVHVLTGKPPDQFLSKDLVLNVADVPVSRDGRAFLQGLVAKDPRKRFPSADAALKSLLAPIGDASRAPHRRNIRILLAACCSISVIAAMIAGHRIWSSRHVVRQMEYPVAQAVPVMPPPPMPAPQEEAPPPPVQEVETPKLAWRSPVGGVKRLRAIDQNANYGLQHLFEVGDVKVRLRGIARSDSVHVSELILRREKLEFLNLYFAVDKLSHDHPPVDWERVALVKTSKGQVLGAWQHSSSGPDINVLIGMSSIWKRPLDLVFQVSDDDFPIEVQLADGTTYSADRVRESIRPAVHRPKPNAIMPFSWPQRPISPPNQYRKPQGTDQGENAPHFTL